MRYIVVPLILMNASCNQAQPIVDTQTAAPVTEEDCLSIPGDAEMLSCFERLNAQTEANIERLQNENEDLDREIAEGFGLQVEDE